MMVEIGGVDPHRQLAFSHMRSPSERTRRSSGDERTAALQRAGWIDDELEDLPFEHIVRIYHLLPRLTVDELRNGIIDSPKKDAPDLTQST